MQTGGWGNPEMVKWYINYASVVLKRYGKKVKKFITINEPYIEFFLVEYLLNLDQSKESTNVRYAKGMQKAHRQLLANAAVIKMYHEMKLGGSIGTSLNLSPCVPMNANNPDDVKVTSLQDELLNTLFLDALYKGRYPIRALDSLKKYDPSFQPTAEEMKTIVTNKPDFLGINFYAPAFVKYDERAPMSTTWLENNPDSIKSNGPVRPEYLYKLLMELKKEYGNPVMMITENGAGFNNNEDTIVSGKVNDVLRADYIKRHIAAALEAKKEGANLQGYFVWSGWDNFEWVFGFTKRFGIIYVDFATQKRTPKQSYYVYQGILKGQK
jgi:beta-glucosidase